MKLIKSLLAAVAVSVAATAAAGPTSLFLNNTSLGGTINNLQFNEIAITNSPVAPIQFIDSNNNGFVDIGDRFVEQGFVAAVALKNNSILYTPLQSKLGIEYELWATFAPLSGILTANIAQPVQFDPPPASQVNLFYDNVINGSFNGSLAIGSLANPFGGGCTIGTCTLTGAFLNTGLAPGLLTRLDGDNFGDAGSGDSLVINFNYFFTSLTGSFVGLLPQVLGLPYAAPGGTLNLLSAQNGSVTPNAVPEPASLALLGLGLLGFAASRRKKA